MKLVFVSNYFNHHQKPLSEAFISHPDVSYTFIETGHIREERLKLGWGGEEKPPYVMTTTAGADERAACERLIDEADVVLWGGAPTALMTRRLQAGKLTFRYHERLYKTGCEYWKLPVRAIRHLLAYGRYPSLHLLCASAYASADFAKTGCFWRKAYKWGYFTELKTYEDIGDRIASKEPHSILWVARFIDWKHPEVPVAIAKRLKKEGYSFTMRLIGNGDLMEQTARLVTQYGLEDCVQLTGSMTPDRVREYMEKSEIFLFTSDRNEGWGAVANEAMNSGCAVVASHAIGSVPFLIEHGHNGYIYRDGDLDEAYAYVKRLLDEGNERERLGREAYATVATEWNADVAADKLLVLCEPMLAGQRAMPYEGGVCSRAERLRDNWIDRRT